RDYTVFVSEDGGPFTAWLSNTEQTSENFVGTCGRAYAFYTVARDAAGNLEDLPSAPDATAERLGPCDLAIINVNAPANVTLSSKKDRVTKRLSVRIQNRGEHPETIPDVGVLARLVKLDVESLGACPSPTAMLQPKAIGRQFPVTLKS